MAKGYWIVGLDVSDQEAFKSYLQATPGALGKFGGHFLARAGRFENPEGTALSRNSVIEFPSYQAALDCYASPEYQAAILLRKQVATMNLVIVEGCD